MQIFVMAVQILAVFNTSKALDEKGNFIEPDIKYTLDGVVRLVISSFHWVDALMKLQSPAAI